MFQLAAWLWILNLPVSFGDELFLSSFVTFLNFYLFVFGILHLTHPIFKHLSFVVLSSFWILCYYYVTDCLIGYFLGLDFLIFIFVVFYSDVSILLLEFIFKGLSFMMHAQSPC